MIYSVLLFTNASFGIASLILFGSKALRASSLLGAAFTGTLSLGAISIFLSTDYNYSYCHVWWSKNTGLHPVSQKLLEMTHP